MTEPLRSPAEVRLARRYAAERRFRRYGQLAIGVALSALVILLVSLGARSVPAFTQSLLLLEVQLDPGVLDPEGARDPKVLSTANYSALVRNSLLEAFPEATGRRERRALGSLVSRGAAFAIRDRVMSDPSLIGTTLNVEVPLADDADLYFKGGVDETLGQSERRLSDAQVGWLRALDERGAVRTRFNTRFFTSSDSREPELAGIRGAFVGSVLTLAVTLALCFPIGVAAAIYLEEFSRRSRLTDFIEVNINNLAAVPSIVFGLLGLAVFLNFFGMPRSAPLVGGLVLALMTLPTVIIAARSALMAVPPSIREAAMAIGASPLQVVFQHVLPLSMPGILTGTIIGMARALGETAPLLMIGMVAFIVDVPSGFSDPSTVLPVQIYLWADSPERAFVALTSAAIVVLLAFLVLMNLTAVVLRNKFERRW
jgi:phosphate transport system permease protein